MVKKELGILDTTELIVYSASLIVRVCPSKSWKLDDGSIVNSPFTSTV